MDYHFLEIQIFQFHTENLFKDTWFFGSAFFGGMLLSCASHGADYMMVQRVLTCGNLSSARWAMIGSGIFVFIQFSVFLCAGSLIWIYLDGIQLVKDQTKFIQKLIDNNLLTIKAAENVVRVLPPLNVKKSEVDTALKIIRKVCKELKV